MTKVRFAGLVIALILGSFIAPVPVVALALMMCLSLERVGKWVFRKEPTWKQ